MVFPPKEIENYCKFKSEIVLIGDSNEYNIKGAYMMGINKKDLKYRISWQIKKKIWKIFTEIKDKDRML